MLKIFTFITIIAYCAIAFSATFTGKVIGVSDGDTITVLAANKIQYKIRLTGIDAPEKKQPFGSRSKQHLSDLVFSKLVTVEWEKTDKYRRTLGKVIVNGIDANLEQIRAGFAWHYKQYERDQPRADRVLYARTEIEARERRIGLWQDAKPIPPWDFRHKSGDAAIAPARNNGTSCPCNDGSESYCTGKRGGHYCYSESGKKRYIR